MLRPSRHFGIDVQLLEPGAHLLQHVLEVVRTLTRRLQHHRFDLGVALRMQHRECEVLELPLDVLDAEPVRERRVDVERFLGDPLLFRLR